MKKNSKKTETHGHYACPYCGYKDDYPLNNHRCSGGRSDDRADKVKHNLGDDPNIEYT